MTTHLDSACASIHPSDYNLDRLCLGELSQEQATLVAEHVATCLHCTKRQTLRSSNLEGFADVDAGDLFRRVQDAAGVSGEGNNSGKSMQPRWRRVALGTVPALLCAAALLLYFGRGDQEPARDGVHNNSIRSKGGLGMRVYRQQRANMAEQVLSGQRLVQGDIIRVVVDLPPRLTEAPQLHGLLVSHEAIGSRQSVLFPSTGTSSAPLQLDGEGALPIATKLDDYEGLEILVLLVCPEPFSSREVLASKEDVGMQFLRNTPGCARTEFRLQKELR